MKMTQKEAAHVLECGAWWDHLPDDMSDWRLETTFSLFYLRNLDKTAVLRYDKYRNPNAPQPYFLSFGEIHISQAQVSRLEKGALAHIRDGLA